MLRTSYNLQVDGYKRVGDVEQKDDPVAGRLSELPKKIAYDRWRLRPHATRDSDVELDEAKVFRK